MKNNPFEHFTENDCVACPTQEIFNQIRDLNPNDANKGVFWESYKKSTYYRPKGDGGIGSFGGLHYAKIQGYTIHQPEHFLKPQFEHLEEIEVSDDIDFKTVDTRFFIGISRDGEIVTESKVYAFASWKYARKIDHKRNEAIQQAKEIIKEFNLTPDELCLT